MINNLDRTSIDLIETGTNMWRPVTQSDLYLMQHCLNEDLVEINCVGLDKLRYVAAAHDWSVKII